MEQQTETIFGEHIIRQFHWMVWQVVFEYLGIALLLAAVVCVFSPIYHLVSYVFWCLGLFIAAVVCLAFANHEV